MKLTTNFDSDEFRVSDSFPDLAASIVHTETDIQKMYVLSKLFLQPVRDLVGPVRIQSGKRSPELNTAVKGEPASDHLYQGFSGAVDFTCSNIQTAYNWLKVNRAGSFGQLIKYNKSNFIHVSLPTEKHVNEAWDWDK